MRFVWRSSVALLAVALLATLAIGSDEASAAPGDGSLDQTGYIFQDETLSHAIAPGNTQPGGG